MQYIPGKNLNTFTRENAQTSIQTAKLHRYPTKCHIL